MPVYAEKSVFFALESHRCLVRAENQKPEQLPEGCDAENLGYAGKADERQGT